MKKSKIDILSPRLRSVTNAMAAEFGEPIFLVFDQLIPKSLINIHRDIPRERVA
jgi:hypothetical protein